LYVRESAGARRRRDCATGTATPCNRKLRILVLASVAVHTCQKHTVNKALKPRIEDKLVLFT